MGSCEGVQVLGLLQAMQSGKIVLQLKSNSTSPPEMCGLCNTKLDSQYFSSKEMQHSHTVKGVFSFSPTENQWTLTFTESDLNQSCQEISDKSPSGKPTAPNVCQEEKSQGSLQYEVDGKVYELKSNIPQRKKPKISSPKNKQSFLINKPKPVRTKSIEFVIEDQKYSTSSISTKSYENSQDFGGAENPSLEASLQLLQVKLMEKGIVPDQINCGPDTSTFLQNMRELAKLVTSPGQTSFQCDQCQEELTSYFPYIEHVFKHLGSRPYVCSVCQASFQTRAVMRHHLDMHGGKAPFECEFCGKKFRNSCHMKQHRMRHTGERPHSCPYCEKTFAHKNVLKIHLQVHTGEKPCCCDLCGKLFREPHRLACHLATHYRTSKALECTACGKNFKTSGMLKLHEAKHCNNKLTTELDRETEDQTIETLQNVAYIENIDTHFLDPDHEVTIIEAETLEVLPVNTYIVEPSNVGPMLVQFSIDQDEQDLPSMEGD